MNKSRLQSFFTFIEESPVSFLAVNTLAGMAEKAGYKQLKETEKWKLERGGHYYVIRNDSSMIAFSVPKSEIKGFHIVASNSDSPTFKIKENAEMKVEEKYIRLNTEKYGGMIMHTWLDRPLSVAGRIAVRNHGKIESRLVKVDRDLLVIPNLAIHMNRDVNKGVEYNAQTDMLPLFAGGGAKEGLLDVVAESSGVKKEDILAHDLFLYVREKGRILGAEGEFILAPRLDDLACAYSAMAALLESDASDYINMCAVFDHEEVGSGTRQGADSTFLEDVLVRIKEAYGEGEEWLRCMIADSFLISADNAHALHPNQPGKADPTNRPVLNGGIVIKYHGNQKYTTDALTGAVVKELCKKAGVPFQCYANRSDIAGGSTLGNISMAHVSVQAADIGLPQLAMHSALETAGSRDIDYLIDLLKQFYGEDALFTCAQV